MPATSRKRVTPGMARVRDAASRSRLQSPSRKRNEADARKASDRSRLQSPKRAASTARSAAAGKKRPSSRVKQMGGIIDSSAYQISPMTRRPRIRRTTESRSHLRRS